MGDIPLTVRGLAPTPPPMAGPLEGIRGIVLTQAWAGNWCTSLLGQMGADVIRPAPLQGEHTHEVLHELLGMPAAEVDKLVRSGVSGMGPPG